MNSGKTSEFIARALFMIKGYAIIRKNYITGRGTNAGEIDFIAANRHNIVFVEVKQRQNLEQALYAISDKQKTRIIKGAESFLQKNPIYSKHNARFDAVLISPPFRIKHIKDAWHA